MLHNTQQNLNRLVISRLLSYRSLIKGLVLYLDIIEKVLVFAFFFVLPVISNVFLVLPQKRQSVLGVGICYF